MTEPTSFPDPASEDYDRGAPVFTGVVAVVDDDLSVRKALHRLLLSVGVRSVVHESGREFLESHALHDVDCLLLDVHMPGMSGLEVLAEVRVAATKLPVILMTGRYEIDFAKRALEAGAAAFLTKPFEETDLFAALLQATGCRVRT
jgi:FixJ family two-component response regulator